MKDPRESFGGSLSSLELAGALSARLAHLLSNHLAVLTGSLAAAGAAGDPAKTAADLQAALRAANQAGMILGRFVDWRRKMHLATGSTSLSQLALALGEWASRRGWTWQTGGLLDLPAESIGAPWAWIEFALDTIAARGADHPGQIELTRVSNVRSPFPSPAGPPARYHARLTLLQPAAEPIPWDDIRTRLDDLECAAAWELLRETGAWPQSRPLKAAAETTLHFPLHEPAT